MTEGSATEPATVTSLRKMYADGKLEAALPLVTQLLATVQGDLRDSRFLLLCVQVLFETEAPTSKINALLSEIFLKNPEDPAIRDYMAILDAKGKLRYDVSDMGEGILKDVLKRSPRHAHAAFLLGTHYYWAKKDYRQAAPLLETCVRERPMFLRAWACLGAIYEEQGQKNLALAAYRKCSELEPNGSMRQFFLERLKAAS